MEEDSQSNTGISIGKNNTQIFKGQRSYCQNQNKKLMSENEGIEKFHVKHQSPNNVKRMMISPTKLQKSGYYDKSDTGIAKRNSNINEKCSSHGFEQEPLKMENSRNENNSSQKRSSLECIDALSNHKSQTSDQDDTSERVDVKRDDVW